MSVCETCLNKEKHVGVMREADARLHKDANPDHEIVKVGDEQPEEDMEWLGF